LSNHWHRSHSTNPPMRSPQNPFYHRLSTASMLESLTCSDAEAQQPSTSEADSPLILGFDDSGAGY
ncbi:MAG TPA: hypothetical protein VIE89_30045, partial [Candidatus Binatia bacterium]